MCDCDVSAVDRSVGLRTRGVKAIFVDFGTQEVILGDLIIQNQC